MRNAEGIYMKNRKKHHIGKTILTCLPMLALLACGAAGEEESLTMLFEQAVTVETGENTSSSETGTACGDGSLDDGTYTLDGTEPGSRDGTGNNTGQVVQTAYVHICGEVMNPGVYEVPADARICDVLLMAGGFTEAAATDCVNMAEKVADGMQVVIPTVEEAYEAAERAADEAAGRVNLNTASAEQLCTLPGIGESRAKAIIAYREEHGGFETAEEIMQVSGIKEGMYEKLKELIYVK